MQLLLTPTKQKVCIPESSILLTNNNNVIFIHIFIVNYIQFKKKNHFCPPMLFTTLYTRYVITDHHLVQPSRRLGKFPSPIHIPSNNIIPTSLINRVKPGIDPQLLLQLLCCRYLYSTSLTTSLHSIYRTRQRDVINDYTVQLNSLYRYVCPVTNP